MKKNYEKPILNVIDVKIEKGFAASQDSFGIEQFQYDSWDGTTGTAPENTAW